MASYNKVILMGHLTRDPQIKHLPSGTVVCDFGLAINRRWKTDKGEEREEVLFIDCSAFAKSGETIGQNLSKGRPLHVEGRLKLDTWEQDGQTRSKIRVIVEQFRFVDRKSEGNAPVKRTRKPRRNVAKANPPAQQPDAASVGVGAEDTPF